MDTSLVRAIAPNSECAAVGKASIGCRLETRLQSWRAPFTPILTCFGCKNFTFEGIFVIYVRYAV